VVLVGWPEALVGGHFRLVAGERRVRAARKLGWTEIGAIIMPTEGRGFVLSVIENIRRRGLTRDERRRAFRRIVGDVGGDKAAAASLLGVSMTTLYRTIADPDALRYANWSTRGVLRQLQGAATGMPAAKRRELAKAMRAAADRIERGRAASTN
jgi:ParB-like chromosome segregation protein Spo0J